MRLIVRRLAGVPKRLIASALVDNDRALVRNGLSLPRPGDRQLAGGSGRCLSIPESETGRAELQGHRLPGPKSHRRDVPTSQVFDLDHAVRIRALNEPRRLHRVVLPVAVTARCALFEFQTERPSLRLILRGSGNGPAISSSIHHATQFLSAASTVAHLSLNALGKEV